MDERDMTMVGDMFNYSFKMTVDNLCNELSNALANMEIFEPIKLGSYCEKLVSF
jgi:hypothetical protein